MKFYVEIDGKFCGPYGRASLRRLFADGSITAESTCCPQDAQKKRHWRQVAEYLHPPEFDDENLSEDEIRPYRQLKEQTDLTLDPTTHCHVFFGGKQHGPYIAAQIQAMWGAGTLPADAFVLPSGYSDWIPIGDYLARIQPSPSVVTSASSNLRTLGILITVIGAVVAFYFVAIYDTSVTSERHFIPGVGNVGGESIVNLGRQQNRMIGVIVGVSLGISGLLVSYIPRRPDNA